MSLPKSAVARRHRRRYLCPNHWILVTSRTIHGRFWFSEFDDADCERVNGLIIAAMLRYGVDCAGFVLMSGHIHLLLRSRRGGQRVSLLVQYVLAGIARLTHQKHGTSGPIWQRRFSAVNLLDHEAEVSALDYVCRHGVKEGVVSHPAAWPLANSASALLAGGRLEGRFPDRANPKRLRRVVAQLSPLTRWRSDPAGFQRMCRALIDGIAHDAILASVGRAPTRRTVDHTHVPDELKVSPSRAFSAAGAHRATLLGEARQARRAAFEAAELAGEQLVLLGFAASSMPAACQWPTYVTAAAGVAIAERPFSEVYAPPDGVAASD